MASTPGPTDPLSDPYAHVREEINLGIWEGMAILVALAFMAFMLLLYLLRRALHL